MLRKISITMSVTILISVVALLAAAAAVAQESTCSDPPMSNTVDVPKSGTWTLYADLDQELDSCPNSEGDVPCNKYYLSVCRPGTGGEGEPPCDSTGLNAIVITTAKPADCVLPYHIIYVAPDWKPNEGPMLVGLEDRVVYEWNHQEPGSATWIYATESQALTCGTVCIKVGRNWYCVELAVVDCPTVRPSGPLPSIECLSINERLTMRVERGPDGCEVDAYAVIFWLDNPTCATGVGILLSTTVTTSTGLICAGLNDQGCPECITGSGGTSATYYSYTTSSGYKVTVCYDLADPCENGSYACGCD